MFWKDKWIKKKVEIPQDEIKEQKPSQKLGWQLQKQKFESHNHLHVHLKKQRWENAEWFPVHKQLSDFSIIASSSVSESVNRQWSRSAHARFTCALKRSQRKQHRWIWIVLSSRSSSSHWGRGAPGHPDREEVTGGTFTHAHRRPTGRIQVTPPTRHLKHVKNPFSHQIKNGIKKQRRALKVPEVKILASVFFTWLWRQFCRSEGENCGEETERKTLRKTWNSTSGANAFPSVLLPQNFHSELLWNSQFPLNCKRWRMTANWAWEKRRPYSGHFGADFVMVSVSQPSALGEQIRVSGRLLLRAGEQMTNLLELLELLGWKAPENGSSSHFAPVSPPRSCDAISSVFVVLHIVWLHLTQNTHHSQCFP